MGRVGAGWTKAGVQQGECRREAEEPVRQAVMGADWGSIAKMDSRTTWEVDWAGLCGRQDRSAAPLSVFVTAPRIVSGKGSPEGPAAQWRGKWMEGECDSLGCPKQAVPSGAQLPH